MTQNEIIELAGHRTVPPWVIKLVSDAVARERVACFDAAFDAHATTAVLEAIRARSISRGEA